MSLNSINLPPWFFALLAVVYIGAPALADDAKPEPPSFRQDVVPILTRAGCNAGSCHGKLAGQNGFKLSLRGYAPEMDYPSLTNEIGSRRLDFGAPAQSLLLLKATGRIPHEGGKRFDDSSRMYKVLYDWIAARAPAPKDKDKEADVVALQITPAVTTLNIGQQQQLTVIARYADGRERDITWLAQFFSNDESIVSVTPDGSVKALRNGEACVRAHFQALVQVATFTMPFPNTVDASAYAQKNNLVDEQVFSGLNVLHLPPSPLCDDATFLRRAFLDTIGTLPTPAEVETFVTGSDSDKRAKCIDALLGRPEFVDYWTLQLADILQNRKEQDHDVRAVKGVRSFHAWLRSQVAADRPWDAIVRDLIIARGNVIDQPEVGYYLTTVGEKRADESQLADSVAQAFLGARIGCARCHNHPLERYTQDDYYHFVAFFSRVQLARHSPVDGGEVSALNIDQKKEPPTVGQPRTGQRLGPQPLDRSAVRLADGQDPREALAAWVTDPGNEYFSGAMVNRLWKHFMGVGMVEQVDDLRTSNPPSNPQLWKALCAQFVSHHYDLKHVMRLILNSRTYQLSSSTLPQNQQDRKFYSHYYARRLPAEVLADAIVQVTGIPDHFTGYPVGLRAVQLPDPGVDAYMLTIFGRSERVTACACERSPDITLPQLLHLGNGDDLTAKIRSADNTLAAMIKSNKDDDQIAGQLFLMALGRLPSDAQRSAIKTALASGGSREEVFRDVLWALLNSKDFTFNR